MTDRSRAVVVDTRRGLERDLSQFVVVQPDDRLMATYAELRATCERTGHGLGQKVHEADRWVAATAIRLGIELISDDSIDAEGRACPVKWPKRRP